MKKLVILILLMETLFGVTRYVTVGKHQFKIVQKSYNIYDSKGTYVAFFNSKDEPVVRLTLADVTGDCSNKSLEDGAYEFSEDTLTLYTLWNRRGKAYLAPYGVMIQKYKLLENGQFKRLSAFIYQEEYAKDYDEESGMQYLYREPKTVAEKEKLEEYIKNIEQKYNATFVQKSEAKAVFKKVKEALTRKVKNRWRRK